MQQNEKYKDLRKPLLFTISTLCKAVEENMNYLVFIKNICV